MHSQVRVREPTVEQLDSEILYPAKPSSKAKKPATRRDPVNPVTRGQAQYSTSS